MLHKILPTRSVDRLSVPTTIAIGTRMTGALHGTALRYRPQTIKTNPHHTQDGQYEKSFEKLTTDLGERLLFRQEKFPQFDLYDKTWGDESFHRQKKSAEEDITGKEGERPAARQAKAFFQDEAVSEAYPADANPSTSFGIENKNYYSKERESWRERIRSDKSKVSQIPVRPEYDESAVKESREPAEYYYHQEPLHVKQRRNIMWGVVLVLSTVALYEGGVALGHYMRTAG